MDCVFRHELTLEIVASESQSVTQSVATFAPLFLRVFYSIFQLSSCLSALHSLYVVNNISPKCQLDTNLVQCVSRSLAFSPSLTHSSDSVLISHSPLGVDSPNHHILPPYLTVSKNVCDGRVEREGGWEREREREYYDR